MPTDSDHTDINVRAHRYYLVRTVVRCRHCGQWTGVVAIGLAPGHETLQLDDEAVDDGSACDTWSVAPHGALLFHVAYLPDAVQRRLAELTGSYRIAVGGDATDDAEACWANHCDHCAARLHDDELHGEPGGGFLPMSEAEARGIRLLAVDEAFEACAAGYADDPSFFDSMSRG